MAPFLIRRFKEDHLDGFPSLATKAEDGHLHPSDTENFELEFEHEGATYEFTIADPLNYRDSRVTSLILRQVAYHPVLALRPKDAEQGELLDSSNWDLVINHMKDPGNYKPSQKFIRAGEITRDYMKRSDLVPKAIIFSPWRRALELFRIHMEVFEGYNQNFFA